MAKTVAKKKSQSALSKVERDPFQTIRNEMNELFDRAFGHPLSLFRDPHVPGFEGKRDILLSPRIDIVENDNEFTMTAELPGVEEKDINLNIDKGTLSLSGEKRSETKSKKGEAHFMERHYGKFERSFTLPSTVDTDKIDAKFDKGVLKVTMRKRPGTAPATRKVKIN